MAMDVAVTPRGATAQADADLDYALALSLQEQFEKETSAKDDPSDALVEEVKKRCDPRSVVDEYWELADPNPYVHDLFVEFDAMFFSCTLIRNGVEVKWSNRMTLCAGVCSYEGRGGLCSIRLSQPLLKLRPRKDLVETLLHEMIHAYLFVTENNRDHDGHGPQFLSHMHRINKLAGAMITVYHSFHNEVKLYKQHWWKCNGPCQHRSPFFGLVKRAMNRPPSPNDRWWADHQKTCGGVFTKIKEPDWYKSKKGGADKGEGSSGSSKGKASASGKDKMGTIQTTVSSAGGGSLGHKNSPRSGSVPASSITPFLGLGRTLSGSPNSYVDVRQKMLEAAEWRQKLIENRGINGKKRKRHTPPTSCNHDIRKFCNTSPSKVSKPSPSVASPSSAPAGKRAKSSSSDSEADCVILLEEKDVVLDLTDDEVMTPPHVPTSRSNNLVTGNDDGGATRQGSSGISRDLRMCPVCGRDDVPAAIINCHVTLCLDDDIESRTVD